MQLMKNVTRTLILALLLISNTWYSTLLAQQEISFGPNGEPVFSPKSDTAEEDGYWSDEFPGPPGVAGDVYAVTVDASNNIYIGGNFTAVYGTAATNIAKWDGTEWSALGSGMNNLITGLTIDGNGTVYAGGWFSASGENPVSYIAKWDGIEWSAVGSGMNNGVATLAVDNNGNVYAGGWFTTAGGTTATNIAKWDGTEWSALGSGMNGTVTSLAMDGTGNVYAGGDFTTAGGNAANYIARWDGTTWSALGSGMNSGVLALAIDGKGNVYAGGYFTTAGGITANKIAKWDGTEWSAVGSGMNGTVTSLAIDSNGNLVAGGSFTTAGGTSANRIALWNGTEWSALSSGVNGTVNSLAIDDNGNIYSGGAFLLAGGINSAYFAKYIPSTPEINVKQALTALADGAGTYDFGTITISNSIDVVFTIENTGTAASILSDFTITGVDAGEFSLPDTPPSTVPAGGVVTFTVRFTPTGAGTKIATVSFSNQDANENPYEFFITGTGVEISTAIEHRFDEPIMQVYPNPVSDNFRFQGLTGPATILIRDLAGKVCHQELVESASVVQVDHLTAGIYFVQVSNTNNSVQLKMRKE